MFEANTYEKLLQDVLENAPNGIDTRQGSIFYDAVAGILLKIAKLYTDLDFVFSLAFLTTATGDYLDAKAAEYGIERNAATYAQYNVTFSGVNGDSLLGLRFFTDGHYFVLEKDANGTYYLQAEDAGIGLNAILSGTPAIPLNNIQGLSDVAFGTLIDGGAEPETDEHLRARIQAKLRGTPLNGNKLHYKTWCEEVDGIGLAKIYPLWNGPNTVKAALFTAQGTPISDTKCDEVQQYVDPNIGNSIVAVADKISGEEIIYHVGDGLGEGAANIGVHFTAFAPIGKTFDISFQTNANEAYFDSIRTAVTYVVKEYFKNLALANLATITVSYAWLFSTVSLLLLNSYNGANCTDFTIGNGLSADIVLSENYCPIMENVNITGV